MCRTSVEWTGTLVRGSLCALLLLSGCELAMRGGRSAAATPTPAATATPTPADTTPPSAPSSISLQTPATSPASVSTPTLRVGGVVAGDTVRIYSDAGCATLLGSTVAAGGTADVQVAAPLAAATHTIYADSRDPAGNVSSCSTASVSYQYAPLVAATEVRWLQNSPAVSTTLSAAWWKSAVANLVNQKIQYYSDGTCSTVSGAPVDLASTSAQNALYAGTNGGTYSFKVQSIDSFGTQADSACSGGVTITVPSALSLLPAQIAFAIGTAVSSSFVPTNGTPAYSYSVASGPGSVDSAGLYTAAIGTRSPGQRSTVRVTDAAAATADASVIHARLSVNGQINALATDGTGLYVGGLFSRINPDPAFGIAAVDPATGEQVDRPLAAAFNGPIYAIQISGKTAYFGGKFSKYQGTTVQNLAKIDLVTGKLDTTFSQINGANDTVNALLLHGSSLYVGGDFTAYRNDSKGHNLVRLDARTGAMDTAGFNSTTAGPNYNVYAIVPSSDGKLFVGGQFGTYRGDANGRGVAKIDPLTGALDTAFNNGLAMPAVYALAVSGNSIFAGGDFYSFRGDSTVQHLVKLNATNAALDTAFHAGSGPNGHVRALAISGSSLYVGGSYFAYRGNSNAAYLAKVDLTTGAPDTTFSSTSGPDGPISSLLVSGSSLYAGGEFLSYRGDSRGMGLVKVSATDGSLDTAAFNTAAGAGPNVARDLARTGTSTSFQTSAGGLRSLVLANGALYFGGDFMSYRGGTPAQNLARIDLSTWIVDTTFTQATGANGRVLALAIVGSNLFVGGGFGSYRGDGKGAYLAKVDKLSGNLDTAGFNRLLINPA